jgi:hypothetical protein
MVASNVLNIDRVTGIAQISFHICRFRPIGSAHLPKPSHQRLSGIGDVGAAS